jgi:hypothetical protein
VTELQRIIVTALTTVAGGVTVLVVGQLVGRFLIEPIYEQRKLRGKIADTLIYYAHIYADSFDRPSDDVREASDKFRRLAAELMARTVGIPGYRWLGRLRIILPFEAITSARRGLIGLSNTLHKADWQRKHQLASQVALALRIVAVDEGLFTALGTAEEPSLPLAEDV